MNWLRGISVRLAIHTEIGRDGFNAPEYRVDWVDVDNVLVYPASAQEILDTLNLHGKKAVYNLCIPKGDAHEWENTTVIFFGQAWRTIGPVTEYIETMVPLDWNRKVQVESIVGT